jgi:predicted phosphodiesterase
MKIAIMTDLHANLPALKAVLPHFAEEEIDEIVHLGDAISIGPQPRECLEMLKSHSGVSLIMGNHDHWYANGLPDPEPNWMTAGELQHQHWTHKQLSNDFKNWVRTWPWIIEREIDGFKLAFMHYALGPDGRSYKDIIFRPTSEKLDSYFGGQADLYFYGHVHVASDIQGQARYLTPGSLGCQKEAMAPYFLLEINNQALHLQKRLVKYDDAPLFEAFESRKVPERVFIYDAFFGGRFPPSR